MVATWAVVLSALVYLCFLFTVAHWGDNAGRRFVQGPWRATISALALAVYCTSWTFFGSVGLASHSGLDFLAIYIGPILVITVGQSQGQTVPPPGTGVPAQLPEQGTRRAVGQRGH